MNNEQLKNNLLAPQHWLRLVYMLLFALCLQVALFLMWPLIVVQFLFALITGHDNSNLRHFSAGLGAYINQTLQFLTYNSEEKPFPFADWPQAPRPTLPQDQQP